MCPQYSTRLSDRRRWEHFRPGIQEGALKRGYWVLAGCKLFPCRPIRATRLTNRWCWEYSHPVLRGGRIEGRLLLGVRGCKEKSGKHQHTTYHTRLSFTYILSLKGSRTSYDPPTDDASTNAPSHPHNTYVQYVEHPSLSYFPIVFGVFAQATGGVIKGRLPKVLSGWWGNENSRHDVTNLPAHTLDGQ